MTDIISWDKAIDKKVKSSDDKDLGKIQSVTRDYIQTKEGTVDRSTIISQNIIYKDTTVIISGFHSQKMMLNQDLKEKKHLLQQLLKPLIICTEERQ